MMDNVIVIGIAGGTGCGKSTMINRIKEESSEKITIISHDFYYKQHNDIPFEERKHLNYDHPNSFDTDLMIEHIKKLAQGESIERPCMILPYITELMKRLRCALRRSSS